MKIQQLVREVRDCLTKNILPFWMTKMVDPNGGFYGRMTGEDALVPDAEKGAILNARILWTFSAAYRVLGDKKYLEFATRAKREIIDKFYDKDFGGVYWSLHADGSPYDTKKQTYALGFALYGLSEYARATDDDEALEYAIKLFKDIEQHAHDPLNGGYFEAFQRDWSPIEDMRLSDKDTNCSKTMNTHLHILEPYTNLYRIWKDPLLDKRLRELVDLFAQKFLNRDTTHLNLFFDDDWCQQGSLVSYGHEIETSWLFHEAVLELGDSELLEDMEDLVLALANTSYEGYMSGNGMVYESDPSTGRIDADRHWWVQCETIVGCVNIYEHFDDELFLDQVFDVWAFIKQHLIDEEHGEWHWSVRADGTINTLDDKAGFWKCPYHNSRMCLEVIERLGD